MGPKQQALPAAEEDVFIPEQGQIDPYLYHDPRAVAYGPLGFNPMTSGMTGGRTIQGTSGASIPAPSAASGRLPESLRTPEEMAQHYQAMTTKSPEEIAAMQDQPESSAAIMKEPGIIASPTMDLDTGGDWATTTVGIEQDGVEKTFVLPTKDEWTPAQAIARYQQTGEHWGVFDNPVNAQAFVDKYLPYVPPPQTPQEMADYYRTH